MEGQENGQQQGEGEEEGWGCMVEDLEEDGLGTPEDAIHAAGVTWVKIRGLTDENVKKLKIRIRI